MTNENLTQLLVVVDRSGSMAGSASDMIGGLNTLFDEQAKLDGECNVDYVQFDTFYEEVFEDTPVAKARAVLVPRGGTALLDAIGKSVTKLGEKLAAKDDAERPGTVIVVIATDGYENSSREWSRDDVKDLIETQRNEWNWDFVFLGANMDAVAEAAQYGIPGTSSMTYDTHNTDIATASVGAYVTNTRAGGANTQQFTEADRQKAIQQQ